ncbi:MAG: transposase domain-containing protein, partial [Bacilli bacterium]
RMFTIGRKNWLFSTSVKGAESSAAAYSIIETAKANGLDPYLYLSTIFQYLPSQDLRKEPESIDKFLPWSDLMQESCKS